MREFDKKETEHDLDEKDDSYPVGSFFGEASGEWSE
jgi:hypothetical protein